MKKWISSFVVCGAALAAVGNVHARDTKHLLPIETAMAVADSKDKLEGNVKFYFGNQKSPKVLAKLGSDSTSKKTNAFGKSDETACNWAFLSALVQLEKRAIQLGANAVVNVVSNYQHNVYSSPTEFECHAGGIMAGVALKGDFVKIANK
ncbi:hypothetical protein EDC30_11013 [Paucimonas lemoignei]|uniref:Excinuclease ATPase subunit n=1 Tax=Paucimonas lemoignei TaxID=29443 RepID=A0A4R3HU74_PAULE|nr:excinuclease ATPase subunit [Paucimonas lemoignei]TCS35545.1 hypothetical protein EDC30_11013 [Paucimonas lemoignei]